jgi:DNA excision repair protein ERCC-5
MVALPYFLGSDYVDGINGIGIVNAMEILQAFPIEEGSGEEGVLTSLRKFKEWLNGYDFAKELLEEIEQKTKKQERKKSPRTKNSKKTKRNEGGVDEQDLVENEETSEAIETVEELTEEEKKKVKQDDALVVLCNSDTIFPHLILLMFLDHV